MSGTEMLRIADMAKIDVRVDVGENDVPKVKLGDSAVVEVDAETGLVELKKFIAVDDFGNVINPMIVDGQVHGGLVQGIGQAMFEGVQYDTEGNLSNASYMDYCMPRANDFPSFDTDRTTTPCPHNPLGVKGAGEAGCIGSTPAVVNAVMDALSPFGIKDLTMPMTPQSVWRAINSIKN